MPETKSTGSQEQFVTEPLSVGFPWRLLVFSIVLFGLSIFIYIGLSVGYESYLDSKSNTLDQELAKLSNSVSEQDQQQFIVFYSQLTNLKKILADHDFGGNIFSFLEANTLPQISYNEAKYNSGASLVSITGEASSLQMLAAQLAQFNKASGVSRTALSSLSFSPRGTVSFSVDIVFVPDFFSKPL